MNLFYAKGVKQTGSESVATVDELIGRINKRPGVIAEYADESMGAYLKKVNAEASHMLFEDGTHLITFRKDVTTRWTVFHEYLHYSLQRVNGSILPGEDKLIEAFLTRHRGFLRIG